SHAGKRRDREKRERHERGRRSHASSVSRRRVFRGPSEQERKDSNPVERLWRPPALPGAHPCLGGWRVVVAVRNHSPLTTHHSPPKGCSGGIEPTASAFTGPRAADYTTNTISTPTRTRTRNISFEARHDVRFTIGAYVAAPRIRVRLQRKARESNPPLR